LQPLTYLLEGHVEHIGVDALAVGVQTQRVPDADDNSGGQKEAQNEPDEDLIPVGRV
jgi:hypothetical protein